MTDLKEEEKKIITDLIRSFKRVMLRFATKDADKEILNMVFTEEFFFYIISKAKEAGFIDNEPFKDIKNELEILEDELQKASDSEKEAIFLKLEKLGDNLKEQTQEIIKEKHLEMKDYTAGYIKTHQLKDVKQSLPMFREVRDTLEIIDKNEFPIAPTLTSMIKTIDNQVEYRELQEKENPINNNKQSKFSSLKKNNLVALPQLFKDAKKLDKILEILAHEENRYILKDEEGKYMWNLQEKNLNELAALIYYSANKQMLNISITKLTGTIKDSFCNFFNVNFDKSILEKGRLYVLEKFFEEYNRIFYSVFSDSEKSEK